MPATCLTASRKIELDAEISTHIFPMYLIEYMAPIAVLDVSGLGWGNDEIDRLGKALQTCVFRHAGRMRTTEMIVDLKFAQHGLLKVMCKEAGIELKSKLEPKNVGAPRDRAFW